MALIMAWHTMRSVYKALIFPLFISSAKLMQLYSFIFKMKTTKIVYNNYFLYREIGFWRQFMSFFKGAKRVLRNSQRDFSGQFLSVNWNFLHYYGGKVDFYRLFSTVCRKKSCCVHILLMRNNITVLYIK